MSESPEDYVFDGEAKDLLDIQEENIYEAEDEQPQAGPHGAFDPNRGNPAAGTLLPHNTIQTSTYPAGSVAPPFQGPPLDQRAIAAVMSGTSYGNHRNYPNNDRPTTGQGSSNYEIAPHDTYRSIPGHARGGYGFDERLMMNSTPHPNNLNHPPIPLGYDGPSRPYNAYPHGSNPYGDPGPRPTVDEHGNVTGASPAASGSSGSQSNTADIPERAPTQERYGLPGLDYLPEGYSWSDCRCNNCHSEGKACSAFPKFNKGATVKDLTKTLIKFPCERCSKDPIRAASCTWNIMKVPAAPEILYWNGAQAISDPIDRGIPRNAYERYKHYRVIDRLEVPPWPVRPGPSNQPGLYQTKAQREAVRKQAPKVTASRPPNQSGGIGKLPNNRTKTRGRYRTKNSRSCGFCHEVGPAAARECDIAKNKPCSTCEKDPEIDNQYCQEFFEEEGLKAESGPDSPLSLVSTTFFTDDFEEKLMQGPIRKSIQDSRSTGQPRRSGRIRNTLASGISSSSRRPGNHPNGHSMTTRNSATKGKSGSGGFQRSQPQYSGRGRQRHGQSMFDTGDEEEEDDQEDLDEPNPHSMNRPCTACRDSKIWCDGRQPCGNCSAQNKFCVQVKQQAYPGQQSAYTVPPVSHGPLPPRGNQGGRLDPHTTTQEFETAAAIAQASIDRARLLTAGSANPRQPVQRSPDLDPSLVDAWLNNTRSNRPEQAGEQFQQGQANNPFSGNRVEYMGAAQAQPFHNIRNDNAARSRYEAGVQPDERAGNVLAQNYNVDGGPLLRPVNLPVQPLQIDMHNVDDETLYSGRDPLLPPVVGPVLPQIGDPPYTGAESCEDPDGCHEANMMDMVEGFGQLCGMHPTKRCHVVGHNHFCVCVHCRVIQDQFANIEGSEINPGQQTVIDSTKYFFCRACADMTRTEFQHGRTYAGTATCTCTDQMTKAWMCGMHRQQAKILVHRRAMLMRDHALRQLGDRADRQSIPCANCAVNLPDFDSGVWQCSSCNDKVVT